MPTEDHHPSHLRSAVVVNELPNFELASYISNYRGRTVIRRLLLIAACCPPLREEAARLAAEHAKRGNDVYVYQDAMDLLQRSNSSASTNVMDTVWLESKEKQNNAETVRLENELKGYKNNLIKESIRMGNEDLGSHYYQIGDLPSALKAYGRMRDYCTTPSHIASTALNIIAVGIEQSDWLAVQSQVHKIKNLQLRPEEAAKMMPKTQAAMGLQQMCSEDYREAALSFIATDPGLGDMYNDVLTSNDVAVYGGLCALASMSRGELQSKVLENASFRNFLELEPHIRRAITFFVACKYRQCLNILENYRADYLLDVYLQPHVSKIYKQIRTKSIVQYFQPFSRITLEALAQQFGDAKALISAAKKSQLIDDSGIESELIPLIESGQLDAKIDMEMRVVIANETDLRADLYEETGRVIDSFLRDAHAKILRQQVLAAGLEVKATGKAKGGHTQNDMVLDQGYDPYGGLGGAPVPANVGGRRQR